LREEGGFTLPEMLVTIMIMIAVLFALYSIFDMGMRVFSFGNDKVEAVENARLGLEKMERELRDAYPYNKAGGNTTLFPSFTSNSITFEFRFY
jgi:prepilin-type N-terminal cleavage/methylation domain-containing protein